MSRSRFQEGPDRSHYHDTLGIAGTVPGGGVTVDNQTDPPTEVTTLIAPGATISGDEATLPSGGALNVSHYGPVNITHETPEVTTNGFKIADIPAQSLVMAWVIGKIGAIGSGITSAVTQVWLGEQATFSGIAITTANHGSTNSWNDGQVWAEVPNDEPLDPDTGFTAIAPQMAYTELARDLYVWVDVRGGTLENLSVDVYYMVATPSAS